MLHCLKCVAVCVCVCVCLLLCTSVSGLDLYINACVSFKFLMELDTVQKAIDFSSEGLLLPPPPHFTA